MILLQVNPKDLIRLLPIYSPFLNEFFPNTFQRYFCTGLWQDQSLQSLKKHEQEKEKKKEREMEKTTTTFSLADPATAGLSLDKKSPTTNKHQTWYEEFLYKPLSYFY